MIAESSAASHDLSGRVIAVAGAAGAAGLATCRQLIAQGATVWAGDRELGPLEEIVAQAPNQAAASVVDFLDLDATTAWIDQAMATHERVDGLVHLVGGWRGSKGFADLNLADWDLLEQLLIRTVQHTSMASREALTSSDRGRFVLVSAAGASKPTAGNAAYASAKAAAEAWTLALADEFVRGADTSTGAAAATILVVKALLTDEMRAAKPEAKFSGFTHVNDLAATIAGLWRQPTTDLNGTRQWLTEHP